MTENVEKSVKPEPFTNYKKSMAFEDAPLYVIGTGGTSKNVKFKPLVTQNNGRGGKAYSMCINRSFLYLLHRHNYAPNFNVTYDPHELADIAKWLRSPKGAKVRKSLHKVNMFMHPRTYTCDLYYNTSTRKPFKAAALRSVSWISNQTHAFYFPKPMENLGTHRLTDLEYYVNGVENKLTYCTLPLAYALGFNKIYLLGTDYDHRTGHWYRSPKSQLEKRYMKGNLYEDRAKTTKGGKSREHILQMNLDCLSFWESKFKERGGYIKSLIPPQLSPISKIIPYEEVKKEYLL